MSKIRLAVKSDINKIMSFIDAHWKKDHILARDKDFFEYEHLSNDNVNFVLSIEDNKINGILGFIKYTEGHSDIATVIWKTLKSEANPMLGVQLLNFLRNHNEFNIVFSPGINKKTLGIYNYLDIFTDYFNHYIMINYNIMSPNILKINVDMVREKMRFFEHADYKLILLDKDSIDFNFEKDRFIPRKNKDYYVKRFFNHPIYKYDVYGVYKGESLSSLLVTRDVKVNNSCIMRIVDYTGCENDIPYISGHLYQICINRKCEYIDFICYGFDEKNLKKACFKKINLKSKDIIVPNYFSPFVQENIKINFMADTKEINLLRLCKADGDQDRPS